MPSCRWEHQRLSGLRWHKHACAIWYLVGRIPTRPVPVGRTPVLGRGHERRVEDVVGNWFVECGMGLRSVTLWSRLRACDGCRLRRSLRRCQADFLHQFILQAPTGGCVCGDGPRPARCCDCLSCRRSESWGFHGNGSRCAWHSRLHPQALALASFPPVNAVTAESAGAQLLNLADILKVAQGPMLYHRTPTATSPAMKQVIGDVRRSSSSVA
jgi:hypothetical protein